MSQSHRIKGETSDEVFQEQRFCGKEELLTGFDLYNFHFLHLYLLHAEELILEAERKGNKSKKS